MEAHGLAAFLKALEEAIRRAPEALGEDAFHIEEVLLPALRGLETCLKNSYGPEELSRSLLAHQLDSFANSLTWAQLSLVAGSCQLAFRELRWVMEQACRARLLDVLYPHEEPGRKIARGVVLERKRRRVMPIGWRLVKKALESLSGFRLEREERLRVRNVWRSLSRHVHSLSPGAGQAELVRELNSASDVVCDLVLVLALDAFPRARSCFASFLSGRPWGSYLPMTYRFSGARPGRYSPSLSGRYSSTM